MTEIKLTKRYPHSREEDITDAFMRGYVKGKADRPQGEWIEHKEKTIVRDNNFIDFFPTEYECSNCGLKQSMYFINSKPSNFCPNCGADMREREGE